TESVNIRHSLCITVQLQLRSAGWARAGIPGEHAALGGPDHRWMEDQRHLAYLRWTSAVLLSRRRRTATANIWHTATEYCGNTHAQPGFESDLGRAVLCRQHP